MSPSFLVPHVDRRAISSHSYLMNARRTSQPIFFPKLLSTLQGYSLKLWWGDLTSGVIVGIVALPLAIAFAVASGVTPDRGLTTAIIAGFLISLLGGSRVQIGGPTGAFVVIVYRIIEQYGMEGLLLCTLMAGVLLILMGVLRLGTIIRFIPYPLTVGFTAGIAVVIFSSQIRDFLGLQTGTLPADFVEKWTLYFRTLGTIQTPTLIISLFSLAILFVWPRLNRKIPASIVAVLLVTGIVHAFHLPVETIGARFGAIPTGLPMPSFPSITFAELKHLMSPAFTIAILGAIESLLSATVADGMIRGRHRSNTELIAQGIANIVSPLFGGIPATGAIARTATNVKNGGKTPIAGIVHAITLLLIATFLGRFASLIPLCTLAAILVVVAYHMSEWHAFKALLRAPRMDVAVLLTTFFLTIFFDLTVAVEIGMLLAIVLFMKRMTDATTVREVTAELITDENGESEEEFADDVQPRDVVVYEAEGAFFFGVAELLRDTLNLGEVPPKVMILRMRHVLLLDASGIRAINDLRKACRRAGTTMILEGVHAQPLYALSRAKLIEKFGSDNFVGGLETALQRARHVMKERAAESRS